MSGKAKSAVAGLLTMLLYTFGNVAYYTSYGFLPDSPLTLIRWVVS